MRATFVLLLATLVACSGPDKVSQSPGPIPPPPSQDGGPTPPPPAGDAGTPDSGTPDAGTPDAGTPDAGTPDAGSDAGTPDGGGTDAGTPDAGTDGGVSVVVPNSSGWAFYQKADGLNSSEVMGASADEAGNLWVAGGTAGVFVLRKGDSQFQQFTLADGLHPYGYMADGSPADTNPYLEAISISGGPAGTAFVGYMGKPVSGGTYGCEDNWDGPNPDPTIYKSGDADKLTLNGSGVNVVHYDIFSGPNVVKNEPRGREKLCNILRVAYQHGTNYVWFGGNHGFAMGFANFAGNPTCDGQFNCAGVWEHVHPAINCWNNAGTSVIYCTGDYYGVSIDPLTNDPWFGGIHRTTRFRFFENNANYFTAESQTEDSGYIANRMDIWPDQVEEPNTPQQSEMVRDYVSGIAAVPDGSAWIASFTNGLRHVDASGNLIEDPTSRLLSNKLGAVVRDPSDGSIWVGYRWVYGLSRLMPDGSIRHYGAAVFGNSLSNSPVRDIQIDTWSGQRRVLVSFQIGVVGVYSGQ